MAIRTRPRLSRYGAAVGRCGPHAGRTCRSNQLRTPGAVALQDLETDPTPGPQVGIDRSPGPARSPRPCGGRSLLMGGKCLRGVRHGALRPGTQGCPLQPVRTEGGAGPADGARQRATMDRSARPSDGGKDQSIESDQQARQTARGSTSTFGGPAGPRGWSTPSLTASIRPRGCGSTCGIVSATSKGSRSAPVGSRSLPRPARSARYGTCWMSWAPDAGGASWNWTRSRSSRPSRARSRSSWPMCSTAIRTSSSCSRGRTSVLYGPCSIPPRAPPVRAAPRPHRSPGVRHGHCRRLPEEGA